jgi:serine/threonine-protein kinase RsbW
MKPATDTRPQARTPGTPAPPDRHLHEPGHPAADLPGGAAAPGYAGTFPGRADQLIQVRREIAGYLENCPAADDMILIADELAANAILHTRSRGSTFRVRCQLSPGIARIEVEDLGGPWRQRNPGDRPHGLDIIQALTGQDGWGTQVTSTGGRIVWARMSW